MVVIFANLPQPVLAVRESRRRAHGLSRVACFERLTGVFAKRDATRYVLPIIILNSDQILHKSLTHDILINLSSRNQSMTENIHKRNRLHSRPPLCLFHMAIA